MKLRVMVIDDLDSARQMVKRAIARSFDVYDFASVAEALPALDRAEFDVIVTDLRMPGIDGLEGLKRFQAKVPEIPVIIMTAFATVETAVEAMKAGAFDYLKKPFDPEELEVMVQRAAEHGALRRENRTLKAQLSGTFSIQGMVGKSQGMKEIVSIAERIAPSDVPVLIEGESGTGKDVLARTIHGLSGRAKGPYLALNMSAIPENLAESELFGHEKGAFSGADQARQGFFAEADGGTLFLDEIGLLPATLQPKLLRVLQDGEFIPVGSRKPQKANVRVVAATNENLKKAVQEGKFREDLWYRLRVVPMRLPPLRERREDIPLLVEHLVQKHAVRLSRPPLMPDAEAMRALLDHSWPGNIRELEHALERALLLARGDHLAVGDFPPEIAARAAEIAGEGRYRAARDAWERKYLEDVLREAGGAVGKAAELSGLHRSTLYEKLARLGLVEAGKDKDPRVKKLVILAAGAILLLGALAVAAVLLAGGDGDAPPSPATDPGRPSRRARSFPSPRPAPSPAPPLARPAPRPAPARGREARAGRAAGRLLPELPHALQPAGHPHAGAGGAGERRLRRARLVGEGLGRRDGGSRRVRAEVPARPGRARGLFHHG